MSYPKKYFQFLAFLILSSFACAQTEDAGQIDAKKAEQKMKWGNYEGALDDFLQLMEKDPKGTKYNYEIAVCYLNSTIKKAKAIPYLELVMRSGNYDPNTRYLLGRAYHFAYRFDEAIKEYTAFKNAGKGTPQNLKDVDREIQECLNGKEIIKFPLKVTFENLGHSINSPFADYYPFIPKDESFIVFNSKRSGTGSEVNIDGTYPPTVFISTVRNGKFNKAEVVGPPITQGDGHEEVIGLSGSGDKMLLYYFKGGTGDIYMSTANKDKVFTKAELLGDNVNSKGHEIAASISADGNAIYFASDRPEGHGGVDIYVSRILPNGLWGPPQNLGSEINTDQDEDFPNISPDGKSLYFSSRGHTGMGGYDIFKAEWDETIQKWTSVRNVGYPINTTEDDMNLRISENGRYGYISALRPGGLGDLDIYRVTFDDVDPEYSVIKGFVDSYDPTKKVKPQDVFITVTQSKTQEIYGNYIPNQLSGRYVMILPPGSYRVEVEAAGFDTHTETIVVLDKSSIDTEVNKNFTLKVKP